VSGVRLSAFAAEQNRPDRIRHRIANKCYQTKINQKIHQFQNLLAPYTSIIPEALSHKTDNACRLGCNWRIFDGMAILWLHFCLIFAILLENEKLKRGK